jgi:hypothetical protein
MYAVKYKPLQNILVWVYFKYIFGEVVVVWYL